MQADYERLTREISEITDELHLAREQADEAKQRCLLLESAIERLEELAPADEEDTRNTPRAGRKRRRAASGWDSLTDAELKITAFVEEGLSNPEIAARLMLSRRTVATHVSHILKKLNVATRTDIARESVLRSLEPEGRPASDR
jgi:DNA-binding CsgD family transcriptional regulator